MRSLIRAGRRRLTNRRILASEARPFLPPNPVIVEAGANDGSDTVTMAELWPRGTVHAFEPIPPIFDRLQQRVSNLENVRLYNSALGAETGLVSMWVSQGRDASSSVRAPKGHLEAFPDITFEGTIDVPITTLDDWAQSEGIDGIDFLWLDMQGHELTALQHALTVLPSVRAIILEVFTRELYEAAPLWPEVHEWVKGQGFSLVRENIGDTYGDALLVSDSL